MWRPNYGRQQGKLEGGTMTENSFGWFLIFLSSALVGALIAYETLQTPMRVPIGALLGLGASTILFVFVAGRSE